MSVLLEGIDITGLVADENFNVAINGQTQTANDGSIIIYEKEILYKDITLVGGSDWGWLDLGTIIAIQNLASVIGGVYTLDYEGVVSSVRFRTEDIPVMEAERLIQTSLTSNDDFYNNIVIKLMEV